MPGPHLLSTFYHFLPLLPMHLAGSQAIPPLFANFVRKKTREFSTFYVAVKIIHALDRRLMTNQSPLSALSVSNPLKQNVKNHLSEAARKTASCGQKHGSTRKPHFNASNSLTLYFERHIPWSGYDNVQASHPYSSIFIHFS
jgi:hypothetical protein